MLNEPVFIKRPLNLLGIVETGFATPAEENNLEQISLEDWLIEDRSSSYMLKVKSDAMQSAGIFFGDYLIVERTSEARPGNIIIVDVEGAWTMKYLKKNHQGYYLESGDGKIFKEKFIVSAVVKGVVRKYS